MDILLAVASVGMLFFLSVIEYAEYKSILTPFNVLAWPYFVIVLFVNLLGTHMGYYAVSSRSILFVMMNLLVFWLAGQCVWLILRGRATVNHNRAVQSFIRRNYFTLSLVLWIATLAGVFRVISLVSEMGIQGIGTEEFSVRYGSGLLAHVSIWGYPSFVLLALAPKLTGKRIILLPLTLMAATIMVSQVKYHIIVPFLAIFYLAILSRTKVLNIKQTVVTVIALFLLFATAYLIQFSTRLGLRAALSPSSLGFIARWLLNYIAAGPIGLQYYLDGFGLSAPWWGILAVPLNIYLFLSGGSDYVGVQVGPGFVPISTTLSANVGTLFGPLYVYSGTQGTILFMVLLGATAYTIYNLSLRKVGIVPKLLSAEILAFLTLGFFGSYFGLVLPWEWAVSAVVVPAIAEFATRAVLVRRRQQVYKGEGKK